MPRKKQGARVPKLMHKKILGIIFNFLLFVFLFNCSRPCTGERLGGGAGAWASLWELGGTLGGSIFIGFSLAGFAAVYWREGAGEEEPEPGAASRSVYWSEEAWEGASGSSGSLGELG